MNKTRIDMTLILIINMLNNDICMPVLFYCVLYYYTSVYYYNCVCIFILYSTLLPDAFPVPHKDK